MNDQTHDTELIEKYFGRELTDQEADQLRHRIDNNADLEAQFRTEGLLVNTIRVAGAKNDLAYLREVEKGIGRTRSISRWYYYASAASITLLLVSWFILRPVEPDLDKLFVAEFRPSPNFVEPLVRGTTSGSHRSQAFQDYESGQYEAAIDGFAALLDDEREPGVLFLQGNAYLATGNANAALENFNEVIETSNLYDTESKWYLSLCFLKTNDADRASALLKELSQGSPYAERAKAILEKLE